MPDISYLKPDNLTTERSHRDIFAYIFCLSSGVMMVQYSLRYLDNINRKPMSIEAYLLHFLAKTRITDRQSLISLLSLSGDPSTLY